MDEFASSKHLHQDREHGEEVGVEHLAEHLGAGRAVLPRRCGDGHVSIHQGTVVITYMNCLIIITIGYTYNFHSWLNNYLFRWMVGWLVG